MENMPLANIDWKLNSKRVLTFAAILILALTLFVALTPSLVKASPDQPWWFLPGRWPYNTSVNATSKMSSNRTMIVYNNPADTSGIPKPAVLQTNRNITFDMVAGAPNATGFSRITIANQTVQQFFVRNITYEVANVHLWSELIQTAPGYGWLDTVGGHNMSTDVYQLVNNTSNGGYTTKTVLNNNKTSNGLDSMGSQIASIPVKLWSWSGNSSTNPAQTGVINVNVTFNLYLTTGYTRTVCTGPAWPKNGTAFDVEENATGAIDPNVAYNGKFLAVTSQGGINVFSQITILSKPINLYTDFIFKEYVYAVPNPPIPIQPIRSMSAKLLFPRWGSTFAVYQGDWINFSATIYNGLSLISAKGIGTTTIQNSTGSYIINATSPITLSPAGSITVWYLWNTTNCGKAKTNSGSHVAYGNYTITLSVSINVTITNIIGVTKTYQTTNTVTYPISLWITIPGNIILSPSNKVTPTDFVAFLASYGFSTGAKQYNASCDILRSGFVGPTNFVAFLETY
jgi:hypothetical protein